MGNGREKGRARTRGIQQNSLGMTGQQQTTVQLIFHNLQVAEKRRPANLCSRSADIKFFCRQGADVSMRK